MCRDIRKPALMTKNIIFSFYIYPVYQTVLNKCCKFHAAILYSC